MDQLVELASAAQGTRLEVQWDSSEQDTSLQEDSSGVASSAVAGWDTSPEGEEDSCVVMDVLQSEANTHHCIQ